ncbi:MAG: hypothetical protein N2593_03800 [Patescibacteria group bacterium]|nr:hypothetical protein [Patescibacteria group bacterium]
MESNTETNFKIIQPIIKFENGRLKISPSSNDSLPIFWKILGEILPYAYDCEALKDLRNLIASNFDWAFRGENMIISFVREPENDLKIFLSQFKDFGILKEFNGEIMFQLNKETDFSLEYFDLPDILEKITLGRQNFAGYTLKEKERFLRILREYLTGKRGIIDIDKLGVNSISNTDLYSEVLKDKTYDVIKDPRYLSLLNYIFLSYRDFLKEERKMQVLFDWQKKPERPKKIEEDEKIKHLVKLLERSSLGITSEFERSNKRDLEQATQLLNQRKERPKDNFLYFFYEISSREEFDEEIKNWLFGLSYKGLSQIIDEQTTRFFWDLFDELQILFDPNKPKDLNKLFENLLQIRSRSSVGLREKEKPELSDLISNYFNDWNLLFNQKIKQEIEAKGDQLSSDSSRKRFLDQMDANFENINNLIEKELKNTTPDFERIIALLQRRTMWKILYSSIYFKVMI